MKFPEFSVLRRQHTEYLPVMVDVDCCGHCNSQSPTPVPWPCPIIGWVEAVESATWTVEYSREDGAFLGLCGAFPSLSWIADTPEAARAGIRQLVVDCVLDIAQGSATRRPVT